MTAVALDPLTLAHRRAEEDLRRSNAALDAGGIVAEVEAARVAREAAARQTYREIVIASTGRAPDAPVPDGEPERLAEAMQVLGIGTDDVLVDQATVRAFIAKAHELDDARRDLARHPSDEQIQAEDEALKREYEAALAEFDRRGAEIDTKRDQRQAAERRISAISVAMSAIRSRSPRLTITVADARG